MSEELSPLGKVVLIQRMYGLGDEDTFEGDSGWFLSGPMNTTMWFVSKISGIVRLGTNTRWIDCEVTED